MRTASCIIGRTFARENLPLRRQWVHIEQFSRRLSTNSAINRGIRRGKSSSVKGDGRSLVDRGGRSGGESSTPRRDGRSQFDHGDRLRGKSTASRSDDRIPSHRGDRSGRESSFSRTDGRSPIYHGEKGARENGISKSGYTRDSYARNGTGNQSMSKNYERTQPNTRQDSRKPASFEGSSYEDRKDVVWRPRESHRWMGRGNLASRKRHREVQFPPEGDNTLDGKRPNVPWNDKDSSFPARKIGKDIHPRRHHVTEDSRTGHRSPQPLDVDDSVEDGEVTSSSINLRNRKHLLSIPYTTPASEFLYGTSVVISALKSKRRKLYKLYVHVASGQYGGLGSQEATDRLAVARKLALTAGVEVVPMNSVSLPLMDKMSDGRPHNGYILEASPLPKLPVTSLQSIKVPQSTFQVTLDHQSSEDEAINGTGTTYHSLGESQRFPFILLLDGIDPGNLGAILRTAYFLGVDAVATSTYQSAPLTPVALKASAGASENITLFSVSNAEAFLEKSSKNGWQIYAAVAPPSGTSARKGHFLSTSTLNAPLDKSPVVLMLGGEGEGLRYRLQKQAHHYISIEGARAGLGGMDSLNVSVASGLLAEAFLRPYTASGRIVTENPQPTEERLF